MIESLIIWLLLVVIITFIHHYIIEVMDTRPIYTQWWIIRGMAAIFHASFSDAVNIDWNLYAMIDYWPMLIFQVCSYYLIFDPFLNKLRKLSWRYRGKNSGWMDRLPFGLYITAKVICVFGLTYSLIVLL
jgi:hypothetical protein